MRNTIKQFILNQFLPGENPDALTADTPLISGGILDSLATLRLVVFLEKEFNIQIEAYEADVDHFNTLELINRFIDTKVAARSGDSTEELLRR